MLAYRETVRLLVYRGVDLNLAVGGRSLQPMGGDIPPTTAGIADSVVPLIGIPNPVTPALGAGLCLQNTHINLLLVFFLWYTCLKPFQIL